ncbi:MAG: 3-demethylubiquinone-9 3-O-methyltransferase [Chitinophagaceae bacterium]|nr:3-demethylubiquinone-9 3-O-methyltransferase [Chitinophagaceae bacterium]
MNLSVRSYQPELLDNDQIPFDDIKQNMHELNIINTQMGGHSISITGLKAFIDSSNISVCEIGCGGGDNLMVLKHWCDKKKVHLTSTGIDIKKECINVAESRKIKNANWIVSDNRNVQFEKKTEVIFSSLFCHHFTDDELVLQLKWMKDNSIKGFFINDLHRHPLAYFLIKIITSLFSSSYLVKNDAPLSVARGFKKKEWVHLLDKAGIRNYTIQWKWAFRYLIIFRHGE